MIEFDLEKAKSGKYDLVQRDGTKVIEWYHFEKSKQKFGCIIYLNENDSLHSVHSCGKYYDTSECKLDLMLIPKKKKLWIGINELSANETFYYCTHAFIHKSQVKDCKQIIEIEIDEE